MRIRLRTGIFFHLLQHCLVRSQNQTHSFSMTTLNRLLLPIIAFFVSVVAPRASEAVFSADGSRLWIVPFRESSFLWEVDSRTWAVQKKFIPGLSEGIRLLARDGEGNLIILASNAVYLLPSGSEKPSLLVEIPQGTEVLGMSGVPRDGRAPTGTIILNVLTEQRQRELLALFPAKKELLRLALRRLSGISTAPAFSSTGRMVFVGTCDLWEGYVMCDEEYHEDWPIWVVGSRFAPLDLMNTDSARDGNMSLNQVAVSGNHAYAVLAERHHSALLRVNLPQEDRYGNREEDHPDLVENFTVMQRALQTVAVIDRDDHLDALATKPSPKGDAGLFYRIPSYNGESVWKFVAPGGKPVRVGVEVAPTEPEPAPEPVAPVRPVPAYFWANLGPGRSVIDIIHPIENIDLQGLADRFAAKGRIPPSEPSLPKCFKVGEMVPLMTRTGVQMREVTGFEVEVGAGEYHFNVHLASPPEQVEEHAVFMPQLKDNTDRLRLPEPAPLAASGRDDFYHNLSRQVKSMAEKDKEDWSLQVLSKVRLTEETVKVFQGKFPRPGSWLLTINLTGGEEGDAEGGCMALVSPEGEILEMLGVPGNCYKPLYLVDLDQNGFDSILFEYYYYEGSYYEVIRWVDGKPVRELMTGDGA